MTFPVERHTIFLAMAGSQAHGTAREGSDLDVRGVCVAPLAARLSLFDTFEQYEGPLHSELDAEVLPRLQTHPTASGALGSKTECVIFDIAKFLGLCATANPNALEILFADERDWLLESPPWRRLYDERRRFLTKKVQQTFLGYAMAQLKKIRTHRAWLRDPPTSRPSREDFGLPASIGTLNRDDQNRIEQSVADKTRGYSVEDLDMPKATRIAVQERMKAFCRDVLDASEDEMEARTRAVAISALRIPPDVATTLNAEKSYRAALRHWESYQTWKAQRNRARAELELAHGYDTKHAMHLIRLMRMGLEVLARGELIVRRPDADELNAIRGGAMSFDDLLDAAERLRADMDRAVATARLADDVDRGWLDRLAVEIMMDARG